MQSHVTLNNTKYTVPTLEAVTLTIPGPVAAQLYRLLGATSRNTRLSLLGHAADNADPIEVYHALFSVFDGTDLEPAKKSLKVGDPAHVF